MSNAKFRETRQLLVSSHNETPFVVAMCVSNEFVLTSLTRFEYRVFADQSGK